MEVWVYRESTAMWPAHVGGVWGQRTFTGRGVEGDGFHDRQLRGLRPIVAAAAAAGGGESTGAQVLPQRRRVGQALAQRTEVNNGGGGGGVGDGWVMGGWCTCMMELKKQVLPRFLRPLRPVPAESMAGLVSSTRPRFRFLSFTSQLSVKPPPLPRQHTSAHDT